VKVLPLRSLIVSDSSSYSNKFNELVSHDVHGGLWEIEEAKEILNLVTQTCLKIIKCNEIVLGLEENAQ
jgi:hypothetical protein